jgi:hypothetical protein
MLMRAAFLAALCGLFTVVGATSAAAQVTVNILNPGDLPEDDPIAIAVSVTSGPAVTCRTCARPRRAPTMADHA